MPTKLLIVDDSALMRRALTQIFETAGGFQIQTARDGSDALRVISEFHPDVVTLDINMPKLDGMSTLSEIMVRHPCPVVMVSSLTSKDALPTLEALALGAVDFVAKPSGTVSHDIRKVEVELVRKARAAASAQLRRPRARRAREAEHRPAPPPAAAPKPRPVSVIPSAGNVSTNPLVLIGVSTGGPRTLEDILPSLPADFPCAVLVAIHMPVSFTGAFARRMDEMCAMSVLEVTKQVPLLPGHVYIARGGADMIVGQRGADLTALISPPQASSIWQPSVDRLVESALRCVAPQSLIGVQLTGMGDDGAVAMKALHDRGGRTIAESEKTAVIFGMPRELIERGGATRVLPSDRIANQLQTWAGGKLH